jgi:dihydrofolate reductase
MRISLIAALARNLVIGNDTGMPWHIPHDLKRFRKATWGKPIIMGRTTLELLGRPLPGRHNIVLTRRSSLPYDGCHIAHTIYGALGVAEGLLRQGEQSSEPEVMVIGGSQVYQAYLPLAQRLYLSLIDGEFPGTAYFPAEMPAATRWTLKQHEQCPQGEGTPVAYSYVLLERVEPRQEATAAVLDCLRASGNSQTG